MKNLLFMVSVILSLISWAGAHEPQVQYFQVTSDHPHQYSTIEKHTETVIRSGRLWIVTKRAGSVPGAVLKVLKPVKLSDVKNYLPVVKPVIAIESTRNAIETVDAQKIKADVEQLSSFQTRKAGSGENKKANAFIQKKFEDMGYTVSQNCFSGGMCNVIADQPSAESDSMILVMAHFDSVGKVKAGADDNASGVAAMFEMARVLSTQHLKHRIRFFATDGEEQGLLGSEFYSKQLEASGEIKKIVLAINMDMVGYNSNGIVELETNAPYKDLAEWYAALVKTYTALKPKITLGAWGSDHVPFLDKGISTLLTIEDWDTKTPCYHQSCDLPPTVNYNYAAEITRLNIAAVLEKDKQK